MEATTFVSRKPLAVYSITERDGYDRAIWTRVGSAFKNRDGSMNLHLDALPTNGKLHVREADPGRNRGETRPEAASSSSSSSEEVRS